MEGCQIDIGGTRPRFKNSLILVKRDKNILKPARHSYPCSRTIHSDPQCSDHVPAEYQYQATAFHVAPSVTGLSFRRRSTQKVFRVLLPVVVVPIELGTGAHPPLHPGHRWAPGGIGPDTCRPRRLHRLLDIAPHIVEHITGIVLLRVVPGVASEPPLLAHSFLVHRSPRPHRAVAARFAPVRP